ncbi:Disintegrin and metalloproteinase domain-containing protein 23 [Varanus komodoensis]|nr:Disintegrin and metalloproteinase domain-containing protein 23 [Varanus komodoensis]
MLMAPLKQVPVECCREFLELRGEDLSSIFDRIVTRDETWVHHYDPETLMSSLYFSGMFEDSTYIYLIEPLELIHSKSSTGRPHVIQRTLRTNTSKKLEDLETDSTSEWPFLSEIQWLRRRRRAQEEGARKGALNIVASENPDQLTVAGGDPILCGQTTKMQTKRKRKVTPLTIGTWNVRTLQDNPSADRPERTAALVTRELTRFNIDIAALCETRLDNEGQLTETGGGYTFFWCGHSRDERRESGVGFVVKNHLIPILASLPKGVNDRLMTMHLPLPRGKQATLINAYAPTMTNLEEVKDKFYEDLDALLSSVKRTDRLILLGDFNARV